MDEILKSLFESELLTDKTKEDFKVALENKINEAVETATKEATEKAELAVAEQWVQERTALIEAIDEKLDVCIREEFNELRQDVEAFRDLEAEFASKLVEAKSEMKDELEDSISSLIEKLDSFLELRIGVEMEELKEDIEQAKKLQFGKKVFESFVAEYRKQFVDEESIEHELSQAKEIIESVEMEKAELESELRSIRREIQMEQVLRPLSGKQRDIMETILKTVPTEQLKESYKIFIGRVLKESTGTDNSSEKEKQVLSEGKKPVERSAGVVIKTGDVFNEAVEESSVLSGVTEEYKRLAGV